MTPNKYKKIILIFYIAKTITRKIVLLMNFYHLKNNSKFVNKN